MGAEIEDNGAIQIPPTRAGHIKKRALKNKAVSVSFNEKDLRDYVTGFHKRKKKRRKEAIKQQEEKLRLKRITARKQRKLEKEFALHGGAPATNESDEYEEDHEESEPIASVNGTTKYDNGDMQVTVTTSEISREEKDSSSEKTQAAAPSLVEANKTHKLSVSKKKSFKKVSKRKSRSKPQKKRDRKKGKTKNKL
ncbi:ribosomal RNA-processing protein 17-like [Populus alba x Populus x berolinensis]|nr:ribosomal RNA-processing protein 17-like [Populus alba x Populus x berolinensis]